MNGRKALFKEYPVMSEDKEKVLRMALKAVLIAAVDQGLELDTLSEAAIDAMLNDVAYTSEDVRDAALAIEVAADALVCSEPQNL